HGWHDHHAHGHAHGLDCCGSHCLAEVELQSNQGDCGCGLCPAAASATATISSSPDCDPGEHVCVACQILANLSVGYSIGDASQPDTQPINLIDATGPSGRHLVIITVFDARGPPACLSS
ncbi:MAG: hypothetical protein AAGF31_06535, partial [Planctomycetota bacterium]